MLEMLRRKGGLNCLEVARILQSYLDAEPGKYSVESVANHLQECRRCGLEASDYRIMKASLASAGQSVPEDSLQRIREFTAKLISEGPDDPSDAISSES